jgi:hypothetical protein
LWERKIRQDHGYNATPAWTFVARLFDSRLRATESTLTALGVLDLVLVGVMFAVLFRAYGCRVACLSLALFGLGYGWRYIYIGCFLRLDWLAALVVGICLLKRERFATAGVCLGYATMVRVFPLLFLLGPALLAVKSWLRGERPRWPFSFAAGFAGIVCVAFVAGSMTGRGVEAWWEFGDHISNYRETWSGDIVGLDTMFVSGPSFLLATTQRRTLQSVREDLARKTTARIAVKGALLGLLGFTMWRAPLAEAAVLGVFAVFLLTPAAAYYWIMLMIVPMRRGTLAALALLLLAAAIHFIYILMPGPEHSAWHFALLSWGYALILSSWLIADLALAIKRRMGS